jgi:beta-lactamase superfamily II metal-dependent hydrolase
LHRFCDHENTATVLLGDLKLDEKAQDILSQYSFIDRITATVLIPHHGADSDDLLYLDRKLNRNCDFSTLVISYGTKNSYKHPKFIYDSSVAKIKNHIAFANESTSYRYYGYFS